jgi:hypothetical protein
MTAETGPDLQMAHHATVKCESVDRIEDLFFETPAVRGTAIGRGRGFSKGAAKRDAARVTLQYIHKHGLPETIEKGNSDGCSPRSPELPSQSIWRHPKALAAMPSVANRSQLPQQPPRNHSMYVFLAESIFGHLRYSSDAIIGSEISHGVGFSVDHAKQIVHTQAPEDLYHAQPPFLTPSPGRVDLQPD